MRRCQRVSTAIVELIGKAFGWLAINSLEITLRYFAGFCESHQWSPCSCGDPIWWNLPLQRMANASLGRLASEK